MAQVHAIEYVAQHLFGYRCPDFSTIDLLRKLGERGIVIRIKYDLINGGFILVWDNGRTRNTDDPKLAICQWFEEELSLRIKQRAEIIRGLL